VGGSCGYACGGVAGEAQEVGRALPVDEVAIAFCDRFDESVGCSILCGLSRLLDIHTCQ
jgi:hypothetical protein